MFYAKLPMCVASLVGSCLLVFGGPLPAAEQPAGRVFHVSVRGDDAQDGTAERPLRTIQAAADRAQPGDLITVHEGVYRERIDPPRGGTSDERRIVYQAAPGEEVVIKGSERVTGWEKVRHDTWKLILPNGFFGDFNPFADPICGNWFMSKDRPHHTGAVYLNGHWLTEAASKDPVLEEVGQTPLWFAEVTETNTTLYAQFKAVDPNEQTVDINVRQAVFYPSKPGRGFITVRGFTLEQAATNWAPPTAEQVGLIGTHWSKGWVIEDNTIRYSRCTGVTLGKYGDEWDNRSGSAEGYVGTIRRALANGWSKDNVGSHTVRNNHISHCEQAGIVGSMGAAFSTITGNEIHDIHVQQLFTGAEMAGIKIHGAVDTLIARNHIYRCGGPGAIWLDWMTQGTRVTANLMHDNLTCDLFVEVNHGPFLVDNNVSLSGKFLRNWSQGGAYVHNLVAGRVGARPQKRETPLLEAHGTAVVGLQSIRGGDDRFFNNLFVSGNGLATYDRDDDSIHARGNVFFLAHAAPSEHEVDPVVLSRVDPQVKLTRKSDGWYLSGKLDNIPASQQARPLVTTDLLGRAKIPNLPFEQPDGSPYRLDTDYFWTKRNAADPNPGPFTRPSKPREEWKVWPVE